MELFRSPTGRPVALVLGALGLAILVGLIALWPQERRVDLGPAVADDIEKAKVISVSTEGCEAFAGPGCKLYEIELRSGPHEGERSSINLPGGESEELAPELQAGDEISVTPNTAPGVDPGLQEELPIDDPASQPFGFVDFERGTPLLWLVVIFSALVVALSRWQGVRSLIGLGVSLLIVTQFLVPAILDGKSPLMVALVGAAAIMAATITLTHGLAVKSAAAMLGTTASLLLTALLALLFIELAHISGFASEQATLIKSATGGRLSLEGLVLAGFVVGALGVLDDVTVSQASTVAALRKADPRQRLGTLYRRALSVGRDHVSATVNTLVLAYVGAALPILLIFANQGTSLGEAANKEAVATEIVGMLVGSIGLIAAVPITTLLAAWLVSRLPAEAMPESAHVHAH
jgi:uncharacterized membrane protein